MAKGRPPSGNPPSRPRDARAKSAGYTPITATGELLGPELGDHPDWGSWHPRTVLWWEMWRRSAMATIFTPVDFDFLLDTALLHSCFHHGQLNLAGEIRLRTEKMGATARDRDRIRLQIVDTDQELVHVPNMDKARRDRLKVLTGMD